MHGQARCAAKHGLTALRDMGGRAASIVPGFGLRRMAYHGRAASSLHSLP